MSKKVAMMRPLPFNAQVAKPMPASDDPIRFVDLFCGIGGFHRAARSLGLKGVFACDIDEHCRKAYEQNYELEPHGDVRAVEPSSVPDHELLCAGFPCQPFSIIGDRAGFADARGTLFFEIAKIIEAKHPPMVVLENVKQLVSHDGGRTIKHILATLRGLGYWADYRVLNALNFGLPQKRERVLIVALKDNPGVFPWPNNPIQMPHLSSVLEANPDEKHYVSERIRTSRHEKHKPQVSPAIWHEIKRGTFRVIHFPALYVQALLITTFW